MNNTSWMTQWNWEPSLILGTIVLIGLYLYAIGPLRVKYALGPQVPFWRAFSFLLGVDLIFLAIFSPIDKLGESYLFSVHMIQHMLFSLAAPPLILLGLPAWLFQPLLRNRFIFRAGKILTWPVLTSLLFNGVLWLWHAPPLYDAAIANRGLHLFSHLCYIVTGLLFWWPLLSPLKEGWTPLPTITKLFYIFFNDMSMVLLGAGLTFMPPLYTRYLAAPRLWGISAEMDQQLGGQFMWVVGSLFLIVVAMILLGRWLLEQERKEQEKQERLLAAQEDSENVENVRSGRSEIAHPVSERA
ncbi:MAG: cytochrome c oxidase assembly protein [Ktedonobacteraceae bacterium]|nr:cytochrome c oxidase assembly protein [Ktedonobacteraceae bacterium]